MPIPESLEWECVCTKVGGAALQSGTHRYCISLNGAGEKMTLSLSLCPPQAGADQPQMVVGKALLNIPRTKEVSEGQMALESFLAKRRRRYLTRIASGSANASLEEALPSPGFKDGSIDASLLGREAKDNLFLLERNCVVRLASLSLPSMKDGCPNHTPGMAIHDSSHTGATKLGDFSRLDCEELAHHVVSQAKVRLKRRKKKAANVIQNLYKPVLCSSPSRLPQPPLIMTSTPINSKTSTPKFLSPSKPITEARKFNKPLKQENSGSDQKPGQKAVRKVVYWSEKQSMTAKDSGIPCVPPSTPMPSKSQYSALSEQFLIRNNHRALAS